MFNVRNYPNELRDYGMDEIEHLANLYGEPKQNKAGEEIDPPINADNLRAQFPVIKRTLQGHGVQSFEDACGVTIREYQDIFPDFAKLASIALVIPVSSVLCERGFSTQNRIKNTRRSRLTDEHVDNLMLISIHGPPIQDFNFNEAVANFNEKKRLK